MQNRDGGWASFDRDNDKQWLTKVPFADHNAMIDPSTADITGRVLECLGHFAGFDAAPSGRARARCEFLRRDQTSDGAWYGRWGVNYIYGTWQVLRGAGVRSARSLDAPTSAARVRWLLDHQNADGGWGESIASYDDPSRRGVGASTPSQTAWALMGLVAARREQTVRRCAGASARLLDRQDADGTWQQEAWTGTGFPKVFYLNYHNYRHYFPLMALAQYARERPRPGPLSRLRKRDRKTVRQRAGLREAPFAPAYRSTWPSTNFMLLSSVIFSDVLASRAAPCRPGATSWRARPGGTRGGRGAWRSTP